MAEPSERTNAGSGSGLTPIRPSDQPERPPAQHSFLPSTSSSTMAPAPQQGSALVRNGTHRSVDRSMWVTTPEPGIWQLLRNNMLPQSPLPGPSSPTNRTTKYKSQTHVMRGTRVTIPTRGRTWDTVLESDPARPISVDVKVEIYGAGIRDSALRARIRVASTERIRLILSRRTAAHRFFLQVEADTGEAAAAPIELFLPSDFQGGVQLLTTSNSSPAPCFSAGILNRMAQGEADGGAANGGVYLIGTDRMLQGNGAEDEVRIRLGAGRRARVRIRMWDVERDAPERWWTENVCFWRSTMRRLTGY